LWQITIDEYCCFGNDDVSSIAERSMTVPIRDSIEALTTTRVAREMGLPISTVHRWKEHDRIPGKGPSHDWRVSQFEAAVRKLQAEDAALPPSTNHLNGNQSEVVPPALSRTKRTDTFREAAKARPQAA
jgi:hypothetical protein